MRPSIYVTKPYLPPLEEYVEYIKAIWETKVLTNDGPFVKQLEKKLCDYLKARNVICVSNGTCALQLAIKALKLRGEIITTPFTFLSTANIIAWEHCRPVFVDIDLNTWNINPEKIEEKITENTTAILPVHVFGVPCDIRRIQTIAEKHGLKVVYDAAHAMTVNYNGKSIMRYGDVSAVSFHATKLFNTAEGGACIIENDALAERLRRLRYFGFDEFRHIVDDGINAKMSEMSAGLGLINLKRLEQIRHKRYERSNLYHKLLSELSFVTFQKYDPDQYNYSYMPIVFDTEERLIYVMNQLAKNNIYPRRYFHPSLNTVSIFQPQDSLPVSERIARLILCLPLYDQLPTDIVEFICHVITNT